VCSVSPYTPKNQSLGHYGPDAQLPGHSVPNFVCFLSFLFLLVFSVILLVLSGQIKSREKTNKQHKSQSLQHYGPVAQLPGHCVRNLSCLCVLGFLDAFLVLSYVFGVLNVLCFPYDFW